MIRALLAFPLAALIAWLVTFVLASAADAQQPAALRRIGVLRVVPPDDKDVQGFRQGLRDAGYAEGRDVVIEWRSANGDSARIQALAADLVQRKVDVIVVETHAASEVVKRLTTTIPIVLSVVADPVGSGLVTSYAHPGGNVTGLSFMSAECQAAATAQGGSPTAHPGRGPLESRHTLAPEGDRRLESSRARAVAQTEFRGRAHT